MMKHQQTDKAQKIMLNQESKLQWTHSNDLYANQPNKITIFLRM